MPSTRRPQQILATSLSLSQTNKLIFILFCRTPSPVSFTWNMRSWVNSQMPPKGKVITHNWNLLFNQKSCRRPWGKLLPSVISANVSFNLQITFFLSLWDYVCVTHTSTSIHYCHIYVHRRRSRQCFGGCESLIVPIQSLWIARE